MLKKAGLILVLIAVAAVVIVFSHLNTDYRPGRPGLCQHRNIYLHRLHCDAALLAGLLGVLSMTLFTLRLVNERRVLRRSLRISESEVSSLRNLPLTDAD